ncbi:MAG: FGGY-family carbohydrate kinase [Spirochaetaceae bacterium]|jgi:xylulokinase|nr:FGGY-family carbohydrate kinase [Spirochaetaceae bacterium]
MNTRRIILCADIGSSALKASFIDAEGHSHGFAREAYSRERLNRGAVTGSDWEKALVRAVGELSQQAPGLNPDALCISGNGPTLVPVTQGDESLPPLHWYRERKGAQGISEPLPSLFIPYAAGFLQENPEEYEHTRYLFSAPEWLSFRCGAEPVTVLPSPLYESYYWDEIQCRKFGLDQGKFPPFVPLGSPIGRVSTGAAECFNLPRGIPIIAGGPDFIMALIGVGAVEPEIVCDRAGSSEGINVCTPAPVYIPGFRTLPHVEGGFWNLGAILPVSGRLFDWYRELTGQAGGGYDELLEELIGKSPPADSGIDLSPGEGLFFPALPFPGKPSKAGLFTVFPGLLHRAGFGRAVLEALGFLVRDTLETFRAQGFPITEMRLSGGQGKNARWNQMKADLTACTLLLPEIRDGELGGDACVAARALGEFSSLPQAIAGMIRFSGSYVPSPKRVSRYTERFQAYRELTEKARSFLE